MGTFPQLNFPQFAFRTREREGAAQVYDALRRAWLVLTPEEWVRQHFLRYLIDCMGVLPVQIMQECPVPLGGMAQRVDIAVYGPNAKLMMLVECKAPDVVLEGAGETAAANRKKVFAQVMRYNSVMKAPYLAITNGMSHFCFAMDETTGEYTQMPGFPELTLK